METQIKLGVYKHFKTGNFYRVLGVGKHSETLEDLVFYEALYNNKTSKFWVRPTKMFLEEVTLLDGSRKPRFEFVSEK